MNSFSPGPSILLNLETAHGPTGQAVRAGSVPSRLAAAKNCFEPVCEKPSRSLLILYLFLVFTVAQSSLSQG